MSYRSIILIVDDEPVGRKTLEALLLTQNYDLVFASNGQEALAQAEALRPDLILLDVMMPQMDGFETCRRLRAHPQLAEVPIVMVTALDDRDSRLEGIAAGADDFISKPFDRVELRTRIQNISQLNRYRRLLAERTKFTWVVERAEEGYLIINNADQILYTNVQARRYLNLPLEESDPVAETFLALAQKHYQPEPQEAWQSWPKYQPEETPLYLVRPASSIAGAFWLQVDLGKMQAGPDEEYLVRLHDVTAQVVEQGLTWTFHGQISHKLRTPLNHLLASLEVLYKETSLSDPDAKALLSIAHSGAIRLNEEIQDIFQYIEALEGAKRPLYQQSLCNLDDIKAMVAKIALNLELNTVTVSYEGLTNPAQAYVQFSRQAVELILWELLENSKKFHPQKSPVVEIKISHEMEGIKTQIVDNGLFLTPDQLAKLWTPYYQAERYFTGQVRGTGLGLSMVASLVWSAGGTCRAYNRPDGSGLIIELLLPEGQRGQAYETKP
jgi:DNA-binding response OmpR family regulator